MKAKIVYFALMTLLNPVLAHAQLPHAEKIQAALVELGVEPEGARVGAAPSMSIDQNGRRVLELGVFFEPIAGSVSYVARDLTLYEANQKSFLVMTYVSEQSPDSKSQKTRIIEVKTVAAKTIADVLKANVKAEEYMGGMGEFRILQYRAKYLDCGRGVFPGAETECNLGL